MSTEPTSPGHKRNQDSLNEHQAGCLMTTLIYFIFPLYFISVSLDAPTQQVCILCAAPGLALWGDLKLHAALVHQVWSPDQQLQENQLGTWWKCTFSAALRTPWIRKSGDGPGLGGFLQALWCFGCAVSSEKHHHQWQSSQGIMKSLPAADIQMELESLESLGSLTECTGSFWSSPGPLKNPGHLKFRVFSPLYLQKPRLRRGKRKKEKCYLPF